MGIEDHISDEEFQKLIQEEEAKLHKQAEESIPDSEYQTLVREEGAKLSKETRDQQRAIRSHLHDVDDLLRDLPADFPYRDTIRGLISIAGNLTEGDPMRMTNTLSGRRLDDVRDKLTAALAPLGLEAKPHPSSSAN